MNLNLTIIAQLVIFLVLMVLLSRLLFRPLMKVLERRDQLVQGGKRQAEEFTAKAKELMDQYEKGLAEARRRALVERERLRAEGLALEGEIMQEAEARCRQLLAQLKERIEAESAQARQELRRQADLLSVEIAEKVLGRKVH